MSVISDRHEYIGVVHIYVKESSHAEAVLSIEDIKQHLESEILDKGLLNEAVDVLEVIPAEEDPAPSASCITLRRARNVLLRTKTRQGFDLARELDRVAWILENKQSPDHGMSVTYDYGNFMAIAQKVFNGENPLG